MLLLSKQKLLPKVDNAFGVYCHVCKTTTVLTTLLRPIISFLISVKLAAPYTPDWRIQRKLNWRKWKDVTKQYVYKPTRCTESLWLDFIFYYMLYVFRTILVHHQEQLYKLYIAFGICRYTYGIGIYQMRCTAYKTCSWWWSNIVRNMYSI